MIDCGCTAAHAPRRIVLTGGPGAGKTAVLELARPYFCRHVQVLPEAASLLFRGGFPRGPSVGAHEAFQRAIVAVQRELEAVSLAESGPSIVVCDRGTVDGWAYWPSASDFWAAMHTTREAELTRYDAVIHLRTPSLDAGYNHQNPARIESAAEAAVIDTRIAAAWAGHPRYQVVDSTPDFLVKAGRALELLRAELPECCRGAVLPSAGHI